MSHEPGITTSIGSDNYASDGSAHCISIRLDFGGAQPTAFGLPGATHVRLPGSSGRTVDGMPCNFDTYQICPHENGTHTECIGHICDDDVAISPILQDVLVVARVVSVPVSRAQGLHITETLPPTSTHDDCVISANALESIHETGLGALIIRTMPNTPEKKIRKYRPATSPYFTMEAMEKISTLSLHHLVVDFPSVDRLDDGGALSNHRLWWGLPPGAKHLAMASHPNRTITEMAWIDDAIEDGLYFLNLQVPDWQVDAAPSRPILIPLTKTS